MYKSKQLTTLPLCLISLLLIFFLFPVLLNASEKSGFTLSIYENPIETTRSLIEGSNKQIKAVIYKFEEKSLLTAIKQAYDRGVRIQLVVDQEEAEDKKSKVAIAAAYGVSIRTWPQGKLHAKFAIFDTSKVITGSFNWTKSAKKKNVELISSYEDEPTAKRFIDLFDDLWNRAGSESHVYKPSTQRKAEAVQ